MYAERRLPYHYNPTMERFVGRENHNPPFSFSILSLRDRRTGRIIQHVNLICLFYLGDEDGGGQM
jgi:hypothetical protein